MPLRPRPILIVALAAGFGAACTPAAAQPSVPLAARRIARGAVLTAEDIVAQASAPAVITGWVTHRVIQPGEPLQPPAVSPPPVIRGGQAVELLVRRGTVQVALRATALADGSSGDTIEVRLDPRRRTRAVVSGPGRVTALLPAPR